MTQLGMPILRNSTLIRRMEPIKADKIRKNLPNPPNQRAIFYIRFQMYALRSWLNMVCLASDNVVLTTTAARNRSTWQPFGS